MLLSPVDNENARLRLALAIPTGISITVANDAIEMLPLVADKTIKDYPMSFNIRIFIKIYYICSIFYCIRQIISRINTIKSRPILIIHL